LQELKEELESHREADQPQRRTRKMLWAAALTLVVAVIATVSWWLLRSQDVPEPVLTAVPFTTYPGIESKPTFSRDGNQVPFRGTGRRKTTRISM